MTVTNNTLPPTLEERTTNLSGENKPRIFISTMKSDPGPSYPPTHLIGPL